MATFAFIHGAGDVGWYWHLVEADAAGLSRYADVIEEAIGDRHDVVIVAQSFGGYVAPIVAQRTNARSIVLVAAMVPLPGESAEEMFRVTGWQPESGEDTSTRAVFYHDVPDGLAEQAMSRGR